MNISPCQTQIFDPDQGLAQPTEHVDDQATGSSNSPTSRLLRPEGHASDLRGPRPSYGERARLRQAHAQDSLAEWSTALARGASPQGRGFEPHSCHFARLACVCARPRSVNVTLRAQLVGRPGERRNQAKSEGAHPGFGDPSALLEIARRCPGAFQELSNHTRAPAFDRSPQRTRATNGNRCGAAPLRGTCCAAGAPFATDNTRASAGNRTRATSMATMSSATRQLMLAQRCVCAAGSVQGGRAPRQLSATHRGARIAVSAVHLWSSCYDVSLTR